MRRIGHVHLKVTDLDRAEAFYRDALGLSTTERLGDVFAFMSWGEEHHDLALQGHPNAPAADPRAVGLYHFAVEVDDEPALGAAARRLDELAIRYSAVDHGISKALYLSDPDGNGIEIYCDTRANRGEWAGVTEPLDVSTLA